jgi:transposase InsO family protein
MEKLRETGGAVAGEGTPGFAGGPEPGTVGGIESKAAQRASKGRVRRFTAAERASLVRAFLESNETLEAFSGRQEVSLSTLCKWRQRYLESGEAGLEDRNVRNREGRTRPRYSPEERRAVIEAFTRSGMSQRSFARMWGVAIKSLSSWLTRYEEGGPKALEPRPREPGCGGFARQIAPSVLDEIVRTKRRFPDFGLRRVRDFLARFHGVRVSAGSVRRTLGEVGIEPLPAPKRRRKSRQPRFFERARPGELWQSDITSFVLSRHGTRVYLVAFLDDHSRYIVSWSLAVSQRTELVTDALKEGIARFGKPKEVLTDQGRQYFAWRGKSDFQKLLAREGIAHVVSRAHHPETLGKCERFWETVGREFWERARPQELHDARERLGHFIAHYNHFRPHQGIGGLVPADRFFGAEDALRKTLEAKLTQDELLVALSETPRQSVYVFGQVGDQQVSLVGEKGKLVIRTSAGQSREVGIEDLVIGKDESDGSERERGGGGGAEDETVGQAGALPARAAAGGVGEEPARDGERGGAGEGPPPGDGDPRVVAGPETEGGGGDGTGCERAAPVAALAAGDGGYGGGPSEAAPGGHERKATHGGEEGARGAQEGERPAAAREGGPGAAAGSPEEPAGERATRDGGGLEPFAAGKKGTPGTQEACASASEPSSGSGEGSRAGSCGDSRVSSR